MDMVGGYAALLAADRDPIPMRQALIGLPLAHPLRNGDVIIGGRCRQVTAVGILHRERVAAAHLAEPLGVSALHPHTLAISTREPTQTGYRHPRPDAPVVTPGGT